MAKVPGFGGFWVVQIDGQGGAAVQHNAEYELDIDFLNDDVTTSGSLGWVEGLPCIGKFNGATLRVPEDDAAYPFAIGLIPGSTLTIWFKRGADAAYDQVVDTIVKSYGITNDQQKARRLVIVTEMGQFAFSVEAPSI